MVGGTGLEPATSSVSRKRANQLRQPPIFSSKRKPENQRGILAYFEVGTGFEPVYTALQAAASPLGQPTMWLSRYLLGHRADDGTRTRDHHLGKVMLYQLSYIRIMPKHSRAVCDAYQYSQLFCFVSNRKRMTCATDTLLAFTKPFRLPSFNVIDGRLAQR